MLEMPSSEDVVVTRNSSAEAVYAWRRFARSLRALPPLGARLCLEGPKFSSYAGSYQGVDTVGWTILVRITSRRQRVPVSASRGESASDAPPVLNVRLKDITNINILRGRYREPRFEGKGVLYIFRSYFLEQQIRRMLSSSVEPLLRGALAAPDIDDMCCELDVAGALRRLPGLVAASSKRPWPLSIDESLPAVAACLTAFEHHLLRSVCLYFNSYPHWSAESSSSPDDMLRRKAAGVVLDPAQNIDDLFRDVDADVDCFDLGGTPALFISSLHLAARLGDAAMCAVLLKAGADVNVNVLLLPVDGHLYDGSDTDSDSSNAYQHLPALAGIELDAVDVAHPDGDGGGYAVDFGIITPLRLARHFGHPHATRVLEQHAGELGHAPELGYRSRDDARNLTGRVGIPYIGIYERPLGRGICKGTCLLYSRVADP